jgi:hypothetical protein
LLTVAARCDGISLEAGRHLHEINCPGLEALLQCCLRPSPGALNRQLGRSALQVLDAHRGNFCRMSWDLLAAAHDQLSDAAVDELLAGRFAGRGCLGNPRRNVLVVRSERSRERPRSNSRPPRQATDAGHALAKKLA